MIVEVLELLLWHHTKQEIQFQVQNPLLAMKLVFLSGVENGNTNVV